MAIKINKFIKDKFRNVTALSFTAYPNELIITFSGFEDKEDSKEFLDFVFNHAELNAAEHVEIDPKFYRPCEVPSLWGDPSKAERVLGWKPEVNFEQLAIMMYEEDLANEQKAG